MVNNFQPGDKKFAFNRLTFFVFVIIFFYILIIYRLFFLQVIEKENYRLLASDQHQIFKELIPKRGEIFMLDKDGEKHALAQNRDLYFLYAVPKEFTIHPIDVVAPLQEYFEWDDDTAQNFLNKFSQADDPYEAIKRSLTLEEKELIESWQITGLYLTPIASRYYPNNNIGSNLTGFYSFKSDQPKGQYGLEGFFDEELSGIKGVINSERDAAGRLITVASRSVERAVDGSDLILTIDAPIQYTVCQALNEYVSRLGAKGGEVIVLKPDTGAVLALCVSPDFNPNEYYNQEDIKSFNNPAVADEYEPGSIFKAITMAAGLDLGTVNPNSTYYDEGCRMVEGWHKPICNSDIYELPEGYGLSTMTDILDNSLNTGAMHVVELVGDDLFKRYVEGFGFGIETGITLTGEADGNISNLGTRPIYSYTGSFGQGITVTPMQIVTAYAAIANGGQLMKPYIVKEIRHPDGEVEVTEAETVRQVISPQVATLLSGMLVSVIENGHASRAGVKDYYLAGKTGTAQVPSPQGGYSDETIHSFVGFGPIDNPQFVIITKLDNPGTRFAASSAAPLFGEIANFILNYYQVPPSK